ncbi:MAG: DUF1638 domain-containing protein [bacterium]
MARAVILACEMIEDEVRLALEAVAPESRPTLVWVESGLHDRPERLQKVLQELIDRLDQGARTQTVATRPSVRPGRGPAAERRTEVAVEPVDEVLLALGFCGKGLQGLVSRESTLVFPRVDDCVSLFLNHGCSREDIPRNPRSYYLTRGWFRHDSSVTQAFADWTERYGAERAAKLRQAMFTGYERVSLIDTQAYDVADCVDQSQAYADELDLEHVIVQGSVQLLERLFKGERDSEIVAVPPGEAIGFLHLFAAEEA